VGNTGLKVTQGRESGEEVSSPSGEAVTSAPCPKREDECRNGKNKRRPRNELLPTKIRPEHAGLLDRDEKKKKQSVWREKPFSRKKKCGKGNYSHVHEPSGGRKKIKGGKKILRRRRRETLPAPKKVRDRLEAKLDLSLAGSSFSSQSKDRRIGGKKSVGGEPAREKSSVDPSGHGDDEKKKGCGLYISYEQLERETTTITTIIR